MVGLQTVKFFVADADVDEPVQDLSYVIDGKHYVVMEQHAAADHQRHNLIRFFVDEDPLHVADVAERLKTLDWSIVEDLALELGLAKVLCGYTDAAAGETYVAGTGQGGNQGFSHVPQPVGRPLWLLCRLLGS